MFRFGIWEHVLIVQFRRLRADTAGAVAIVVAILAPILIGAMGLGGETGYWYLTQRKLQNGADVAAHGTGYRMLAGGGSSAMQTTAEYLVVQAGNDPSGTTVVVNQPPSGGAYAGDSAAVEVIATKTVPRMFSAIYSQDPVEIDARAVALTWSAGTGCVLALSRTAAGAVTISGSADATLAVCDMVSNAAGPSSFLMSGESASLSANCIQTGGTATTNSNLTLNCQHLREHAGPIEDPFAAIEEPALTGACQSGSVGQNGTTTTVTPVDLHASGMASRHYCNGLALRGTVMFEPGLYLIEGGDFIINSNATIIGDGVVFYLADGVNLRFNGTATVDLSAPLIGPYAGILIFGNRDAAASHLINGNLGSTLDGAIYAPGSHLDVTGSAQTSGGSCTQFVTDTVTFSGSGTINVHCENPVGPTIEVPEWVALVE